MFTGIIEAQSTLVDIKKNNNNIDFHFKSNLVSEFRVDQSISHNGVCLTVVDISDDIYVVTAINETLNKSNLDELEIGDSINIERSMLANGRLDGHIVQGHVDQTGICENISEQGGSFLMNFKYSPSDNITVEKGSICINGISLTVVNSKESSFSVAIIPYTWENTNLKDVKIGGCVNLEFDILGKYISKLFFKS
jgi:riboflavin synthase